MKSKQLLLQDYLGKKDLTENLVLADNLTFHWANWDQTCLLQRKIYKNFNHNFHLSKLNTSLTDLKNTPVWLCNKVKVLKSDLYSLYESYLDSRLRMTWFDRKEEILFSFESEQGPYQTLTTMKWLDKKVYSKFVLRKILLDYFTLRSFRLNTTLPTIFKLNNDVNFYHDKVEVHQISEAGIILKFKDKNFFNKIKNSTSMEISIPVKQYEKTKNKTFEDSINILQNHKEIYAHDYQTYILESRVINFYGNATNTKRSGEEEFYIFARYEDFQPFKNETMLNDLFKPMVIKTKTFLESELIDINLKEEKKSA